MTLPRSSSALIFEVGCAGPRMRVLVLTAGYGEGHNAAARGVAAACDEVGGPDTARIADIFAAASPRLNALIRRSYLFAINRTPRLWSRAYAWMDRSTLLPLYLRALRRDRRFLEDLITIERPNVVCSTYPAYAFLIERLRRAGRFDAPHFNIVTDSISINSLWWRAGASGWFVADSDSAEALRLVGIPPERVHVLGFPVTSFFSRHASEFAPPELAAGGLPRVLFILNSGTRHAEATARRLFAETGWGVTCAVGRDESMRRRLERLAAGRPGVVILGWTDRIPELLMTHHVVISKAGGATTQEAIAARCPMIVSQVVPGQEEGNYELLRRHGIGTLAETPEAVETALRAAFADGGAIWSRWREALGKISRPNAARDIAERLLQEARHPAGAESRP